MAGRKPKPTALKKLEGNPGKRKLNMKEPVPANGMQRPNPWVAIPSSVIIQLARILHTSPNYILLGEVKEEGWMEEMYELMKNIKSPDMRRLALKQLRCVAEVLIVNKFFQKRKNAV